MNTVCAGISLTYNAVLFGVEISIIHLLTAMQCFPNEVPQLISTIIQVTWFSLFTFAVYIVTPIVAYIFSLLIFRDCFMILNLLPCLVRN